MFILHNAFIECNETKPPQALTFKHNYISMAMHFFCFLLSYEFALPNSFGSQFACAFEYIYIQFKSIDFIATCNECSSISNTQFTVCCVCVCVRLRYDETRNLIIIVVHLDSWKPNMKVKNAVFATMYAFRPVLKEHLYACSFAVSV